MLPDDVQISKEFKWRWLTTTFFGLVFLMCMTTTFFFFEFSRESVVYLLTLFLVGLTLGTVASLIWMFCYANRRITILKDVQISRLLLKLKSYLLAALFVLTIFISLAAYLHKGRLGITILVLYSALALWNMTLVHQKYRFSLYLKSFQRDTGTRP